MKLQTIQRYIAEHRSELSADPERVAILRRIVEAEKAREKAAAADPLASQAFLRIERVTSGVPVELFGQPVPSRAFNRIELIAGRTDPETGDRVPGEPILRVLASEETLTNLILRSNRGDPDIWLTGESLGGFDLGPFPPKDRDGRAVIDGKIAETATRSVDGIDAIIARIRSARLPLSAKAGMDIARDLDVADQTRNAEFYVEMHHEILGKQLVGMQVEAAHTVQNAARIMQAMEQLRLAPPEESLPPSASEIDGARLKNPLLNAAVDHYNPEEAAVMRQVLVWSLRQLAGEVGIEGYDPETDDAHAGQFHRSATRLRSTYQGVQGATEKAQALCRMLNQVNNPHVLRGRASGSPHMLTASVTQISGNRNGLHSDFSRSGSDLIRMTISKAEVSEDFGRERVRERNQLVELHISPEEFMTALRGHPSGEPVRCKLNWIHGERTPEAPYRNRYDIELEQQKCETPDDSRKRLRAAINSVALLLGGGIRTAADREALIQELGRLRDQSELHGEAMMRQASDMSDGVERVMQDQYREQIGRIMEAAGIDPELLMLGAGGAEAPTLES